MLRLRFLQDTYDGSLPYKHQKAYTVKRHVSKLIVVAAKQEKDEDDIGDDIVEEGKVADNQEAHEKPAGGECKADFILPRKPSLFGTPGGTPEGTLGGTPEGT